MRGRDRHVCGVDRSLAGHGRGVKEPSRQRTRSVRHCKHVSGWRKRTIARIMSSPESNS